MAEHKDLPNEQLHEPLHIKDLTGGAGDVGKVIVAKGDGTSEARKLVATDVAFLPAREVIVNSVDDFPTAVGNTRTLSADTHYTIGGAINVGTDRIILSNNSVLKGIDEENAVITYTGTGALLTSNDVAFHIQDLTLSAASGTYFNHSDNSTKKLTLDNVRLETSAGVGTFSSTVTGSYLVFLNVDMTAQTVGMTLQGAWKEFIWQVGNGSIGASGTLINLSTATFEDLDLSSLLVDITSASATFLNGLTASGNIATGDVGRLTNNSIINSGVGTVLNGIDADDTRWRFLNNLGIRDSRPDVVESFSSNATATVISVAATPVKINATWTDNRKSQFTQAADGRVTFVGSTDVTLPIIVVANLQMASGSATDCKLYIAVNGTVVGIGMPANDITTSKPVSATAIWQDVLSTGDYVEAWVENTLGTANIVVTDAILRIN